MKVRVENLGPIREGEIDLGKPLTVFLGRNNSGKTYMSYLVYGLMGRGFLYIDFTQINNDLIKDFSHKLITNGNINIDLVSIFERYKNEIQEYYDAKLHEISKRLLGTKHSNPIIKISLFDLNLNRIINDNSLEISQAYLSNYKFIISGSLDGLNIKIETFKDQEELDLEIMQANFSQIFNMIIDRLLFGYSQQIYFDPAERIGATVLAPMLISNQLDVLPGTNSLIKELPFAIHSFLRRLMFRPIRNKASEFSRFAEMLEKDVIKTTVNRNNEGIITFITQNGDNKIELDIKEVSSTIKALSNLIVFLKYDATPDTVLIIDEPELHLHTDSQRRVAQVLAMLVRAGLKVVVSTHSFTILQEFNNLLLLGGKTAKANEKARAKVMKEYDYTEEMLLDPETDAAVYWFGDGTIKAVPVDDREGIQAEEMIKIHDEALAPAWAIYNRVLID